MSPERHGMSVSPLFKFLKGLEKENNKSYVDAHRQEYQELRKQFVLWVDQLINDIARFDPKIEPVHPKSCLFRINRDARFSRNKNPYNTHFSAYIARGGKKSEYAGYYFRLQPGGRSMLGVGLYNPPPKQLLATRIQISQNYKSIKKILSSQTLKKTFESFEGERLATYPRGFSPKDPALDLIQLKSWGLFKAIDDKTVLDQKFHANVLRQFKIAKPLNDFLNEGVIPRIEI
ncbi:DUF2461 domain-containing protein [bacterium]|nr:DUF2461 domain-containing protein [bacterium]